MSRKKADPLLAALIDKLPQPGTAWADHHQLAWLKLMAMAFGNVYGGNVAALLGGGGASSPADAPPSPPAPTTPKPMPEVSYPFIIDTEGVARNGRTKKPILPSDVTDTLYDLRGEALADMRTIIWADGSQGINGADLAIAVV
jgi:hypothetical protein